MIVITEEQNGCVRWRTSRALANPSNILGRQIVRAKAYKSGLMYIDVVYYVSPRQFCVHNKIFKKGVVVCFIYYIHIRLSLCTHT